MILQKLIVGHDVVAGAACGPTPAAKLATHPVGDVCRPVLAFFGQRCKYLTRDWRSGHEVQRKHPWGVGVAGGSDAVDVGGLLNDAQGQSPVGDGRECVGPRGEAS